MENKYWIITLILAVGLVFVSWQATTPESVNTIQATGEATKTVTPDQATISIGFVNYADELEDAQSTNTETMNKVLDAIKALGVPEEKIKTTYYDVSPQYNWNDEKREIINYKALHRVKVTLKDIDMVGDVIESSALAGANDIGSASYGLQTETEETIRQELFSAASENARLKADNIAEGLDERVKGVHTATIQNFYYPIRYGMASAAGEDSESTSLQSGETEVSVTVSVEFLI